MPIPFGFGVGDFIAVCKLILGIHDALMNSKSACDEYRSLVLQLESLLIVMKELRLKILSKQLPHTSPTYNAIVFEVKMCEGLMSKFLQETKNYRDSLSQGGSRNRVKDIWRKMSWGLFKKEDVQELRSKLGIHIGTITMLLAINRPYVS